MKNLIILTLWISVPLAGLSQKEKHPLVIITDHETGGFSIICGDMKTGQVEGKFTTGNHTGVMIPVFAFGPESEKFSGIYENTEIFHKMIDAFDFKK
jgi:alkaline phosphatase